MVIKKIILTKFKRYALNKIDTFVYEPQNRLQIILGGNGSGKSSLLYELSPLPANINKDYFDGGSKVIEISHLDHEYKLSSGINGNKHSFMQNGVELNPGGTKKVQLILVKEYFNITPLIHDVMIGKKTFTNMSTNERKKWFSMISTVDFTYPISVYDKLRTNLRDIKGSIKLTNTRLIELEKETISKEEVIRLHKLKKEMVDIVDNLLTSITPIEDIKDNIDVIKKLLTLASNKNIDFNIPSLENERAKLINYLDILKNDIKKFTSELEKVENNIDTDKDKLLGDINKLQEELTSLKDTYLFKDLDIKDLETFMLRYYNELETISRGLSEYSSIEGSVIDLRALEGKYERLSSIIEKSSTEEEKLRIKKIELDELSKNDKITCPNCSHTWIHNHDAEVHKRITEEFNQSNIKLTTAKKQFIKLGDKITTLKSKLDLEDRLFNILKEPVGKILHEFMTTKRLNLFTLLNLINISLDKWAKIPELTVTLNNIIEQYKLSNTIKDKHNSDDKEKLEENLNKSYSELYKSKDRLVVVEKDIKEGEKYIKLYDRITAELKHNYKYRKGKKLNELNSNKKLLVTELRKEIELINVKLKEVSVFDGKISEYENMIKEYEKRRTILEILIKGLCPSGGLIAKTISSYLANFTDHMNFVISKVWSYDMKIVSSSINDKGDLDYLFPVTIPGNMMDDVNDISTGMKEIVNLSFKLMSMSKLGLESYPLILDEFGKSMDVGHRIKAYQVIDSDITERSEQIFMVSHYKDSYGSFKNADIVVISPDNLDLANSVSFNKCVKIS